MGCGVTSAPARVSRMPVSLLGSATRSVPDFVRTDLRTVLAIVQHDRHGSAACEYRVAHPPADTLGEGRASLEGASYDPVSPSQHELASRCRAWHKSYEGITSLQGTILAAGERRTSKLGRSIEMVRDVRRRKHLSGNKHAQDSGYDIAPRSIGAGRPCRDGFPAHRVTQEQSPRWMRLLRS